MRATGHDPHPPLEHDPHPVAGAAMVVLKTAFKIQERAM